MAFKVLSQNMALNNARGITSWFRRREQLVRTLLEFDALFWFLQELPKVAGGRSGRG